MINPGIARAITRLTSRCNVIVFGYKAGPCQSLRNNVIVQARQKMQLPRGNTTVKKDTEFYAKYDSRIGTAGYVLLSAPIAALCLGIWQIQRHEWKTDLIEKVKTRLFTEPIELPTDLEELKSKEFYPVKVRGKFLHDLEFSAGLRGLIDPKDNTVKQSTGFFTSNESSTPGFHIITPFKLEDRDLIILVNRGWVPTKYRQPVTRKDIDTDETVEITGIVRLSENRPVFVPNNVPAASMWFYRDVEAMAESTGAAPIYIEQTYNENLPPNAPIGGQTRASFVNNHLTYTATWFLLSASWFYMWFVRYIKKKPIL